MRSPLSSQREAAQHSKTPETPATKPEGRIGHRRVLENAASSVRLATAAARHTWTTSGPPEVARLGECRVARGERYGAPPPGVPSISSKLGWPAAHVLLEQISRGGRAPSVALTQRAGPQWHAAHVACQRRTSLAILSSRKSRVCVVRARARPGFQIDLKIGLDKVARWISASWRRVLGHSLRIPHVSASS